MRIGLFNRVLGDVVRYDSSFALRQDALGRLSLSPEQKITSVLRMLAYGSSADSVDEYCRMGASTTLACFKQFCNAVVNIYSSTYLREPNNDDMRKLLQKASRRGFPGMIGSIDCMHWEWRNCPTAWQGAYTGHMHRPTIILEAVASYNTWLWHAFFGSPGSNNDINVLGMSPVFDRIVNGSTPRARFTVNGQVYDTCYYLADGIYPSWSTLVKTFRNPTTNKESLFAQYQEAYRKDVERAFGILQSRWEIVRGPGRAWDVLTLRNIMLTCIILHNMIIEDEQVDSDDEMLGDPDYEIENPRNDLNRDGPTLVEYLARNNRIRNAATHHALRTDLVEHVWNLHGNN
ncbi:Protein ALP1-like [Linum perenne]